MNLAKKFSLDSKGFTIVELIIAMAFFSFILLFVSASFIQINRQFVKGETTRQIQRDGRLIMEQLTRDLRTAERGQVQTSDSICTTPAPPGGPAPCQLGKHIRRICFGNSRYAWSHLEDIDTSKAETFDGTGDEISFIQTNDYDGSNCIRPIDRDTGSIPTHKNTAIQYISIDENFGGIIGLYGITATISTPQAEIIGAGGGEFANCELLQASTAETAPEYCSFVRLRSLVNIRS